MYKLFDKQGNQVEHSDLQDKGSWCKIGKTSEEVFIKKYGHKLNLIMNPEKKANKYAADLFNLKSKNVGDLKTQNTPFFQSFDRFSIDARYAVTFNENDYLRYLDLYPQIELFFWVDWLVTRFESNKIINVNL